ncbi:MAG: hypothetical protein RR376_22750 [Janthinobacterium sp.]
MGREPGADILARIRANALLDHGVAGIERRGYGNLSQTGIEEYRQLAVHMLAWRAGPPCLHKWGKTPRRRPHRAGQRLLRLCETENLLRTRGGALTR